MLLRLAVVGGGDVLRDTADALASHCYERGAFPSPLFDTALDLLGGKEFQGRDDSWHLLRVFEECWAFLDEGQRARLVRALEANYGSWRDPTAWFVASELFGEYARDEAALGALCRLAASSPEGPRALVPHGLEHLVKNAPSPDLADQALEQLRAMARDPSALVRGEAALSLQRLG